MPRPGGPHARKKSILAPYPGPAVISGFSIVLPSGKVDGDSPPCSSSGKCCPNGLLYLNIRMPYISTSPPKRCFSFIASISPLDFFSSRDLGRAPSRSGFSRVAHSLAPTSTTVALSCRGRDCWHPADAPRPLIRFWLLSELQRVARLATLPEAGDSKKTRKHETLPLTLATSVKGFLFCLYPHPHHISLKILDFK